MSGPCKLIEPFLQQSAELFQDDLDVVKFDVDAEDTDDVQVELLLQGALPQALPHLVLFHKGKVVAVHSGVLKQDQLNDFVKKTLMKIQTSNTATIKLAPEPRRVTWCGSATSASTTSPTSERHPVSSRMRIVAKIWLTATGWVI